MPVRRPAAALRDEPVSAPHRLLAVVIVVATALFAIGISIESGAESEESPAHAEAEAEGEAHAEVAGEPVAEKGGEGEEELLGVDPESTPLVVAAALVSLAFAAGVWLRPDLGPLLLVVGVAMLVFAALDLREVVHQIDEGRGGLAVLAGVVASLHASAAPLARRGAGQDSSPLGGVSPSQ